MKKGYQNIYFKTVECHFSYYYSYYYSCYIHRKDKQQWQIPHEIVLFEKFRFSLFEVINSNRFLTMNYNTTGKIILYLVKNLDSVVLHVRHSYSSITKICGRPWTIKLSYLTTFTPKLCNKRSIKFKNLNSVIISITDH